MKTFHLMKYMYLRIRVHLRFTMDNFIVAEPIARALKSIFKQ